MSEVLIALTCTIIVDTNDPNTGRKYGKALEANQKLKSLTVAERQSRQEKHGDVADWVCFLVFLALRETRVSCTKNPTRFLNQIFCFSFNSDKFGGLQVRTAP